MGSKLALLGGPKAVEMSPPLYPVIGEEEVTGAMRALMQRQMSVTTHAGVVGEMEEKFGAYFGAKHCHSFNSGTASIHSALFAVGVKPGDKVLTANHTWISGITAICHGGAIPVFCDIAPGGEWIDPDEIRRKGADPHVKAVIVTHLYGVPADMDGIMAAAREVGIKVVEDCSHAHGGKYKGRYLGTIGDAGCFSLQGSKGIVAGEGGFLLANDKLVYERSVIPADHGSRLKTELTLSELEPFSQGGGAWTYRISPMCAAVAIAQLDRLKTLNEARRENFEQLRERLADFAPFVGWFPEDRAAGTERGWYGVPGIYDGEAGRVSRDVFINACQAEGVPCNGNGYANWYQVPVFQDVELFGQLWTASHVNGVKYQPLEPGSLPNNEELRKKHLHFAIPAERAKHYIDHVADAIEKVVSQMDVLVEHANASADAKQPAGV